MRPRYAPEPDRRTHYEVERAAGKGWAILGLTVAGALVALVAASPALGEAYISAHGGFSVWDCTSNSCEVESRRPGGYRAQAAVGRQITPEWAIEAELSWQRHDIHGINPGDGRNLTGDGNTLHAVSLMGNAAYHLPEFGVLHPYVMAGAGVTRQIVDGGGRRPLDDEMWTLSGQVGLGARYPLTASLSLDTRYVYWRALGTEVDAPSGLGNGLDLDHDSHSVLVGVVWAW